VGGVIALFRRLQALVQWVVLLHSDEGVGFLNVGDGLPRRVHFSVEPVLLRTLVSGHFPPAVLYGHIVFLSDDIFPKSPLPRYQASTFTRRVGIRVEEYCGIVRTSNGIRLYRKQPAPPRQRHPCRSEDGV